MILERKFKVKKEFIWPHGNYDGSWFDYYEDRDEWEEFGEQETTYSKDELLDLDDYNNISENFHSYFEEHITDYIQEVSIAEEILKLALKSEIMVIRPHYYDRTRGFIVDTGNDALAFELETKQSEYLKDLTNV